MIHTLVMVALWFLGLFIAFKMGQASEQIRVQSVLRSTLQGRELQTVAGRGRGASRPSSTDAGPPESVLYDREQDTSGAGLYLLPRRGAAE